jgi:hypothetical protein
MMEEKEPTGEIDGDPVTEAEQPKPDPEPAEMPLEDIARVDIVTGDKRVVMSLPLKEFEEFKESFKAMMLSFGNVIEATGLEISKDETSEKIGELSGEIEKLRDELRILQVWIRDQLVTKDKFGGFQINNYEKMVQSSEDYVRRSDFIRFLEGIREVL